MQKPLRIAAVDLDAAPQSLDANLEKIARWCATARDAAADLVLFPELSLTGFLPNHPTGDHSAWLRTALTAAREMAQKVDAPAIRRLVELARRFSLGISCGLLEDAGPVLYNTQLHVASDGSLTAFRKMHIPMFEMPFYVGGDAPGTASVAGMRVSTNICFDALIPESTRLAALAGAEVVLFPFAADPPPGTASAWADWAVPAIRSRCMENGVFGVAANYRGAISACGVSQVFPGGLVAVAPNGAVIEQKTDDTREPQMLTVDCRPEDLAAARAEPEYLFRFRRPELYAPLTRPGVPSSPQSTATLPDKSHLPGASE